MTPSMKAWFNQNWGGLLAASIVAISVYAARSWIENVVHEQTSVFRSDLEKYMPKDVWTTWASERSEWRSLVEARISILEKTRVSDREELIRRLDQLDGNINLLRALLETHTAIDKKI